jgi:hypothetical protein
MRLFNKFQQVGYFDQECMRVLDKTIVCCIGLALLGLLKLTFSNYNDIDVSGDLTLQSSFNLFSRFVMNIIVFKEPQTMYLLLATILWTIKQFVKKAILVKSENEAFI